MSTAYGEFMQKHGRLVAFLVRRAMKGLPGHMREDLEQAAAAGVLAALAEGLEEPCQVGSRVATELNAVVRPARRRVELEAGLDEALEVPGDGPDAEEVLCQVACADTLGRLVASLPDAERVVAQGRWLSDPPRTLAALAVALDTTMAVVRGLEARARARLADAAAGMF